MKQMYLVKNDKRILIKVADNFWARLFGLIGKKNVSCGMLFFNCNAIHSLFMLMDIMVIIMNKNMIVLDKVNVLKPFKTFRIKRSFKKTNILELPINISLEINIGDKLFFESEKEI